MTSFSQSRGEKSNGCKFEAFEAFIIKSSLGIIGHQLPPPSLITRYVFCQSGFFDSRHRIILAGVLTIPIEANFQLTDFYPTKARKIISMHYIF